MSPNPSYPDDPFDRIWPPPPASYYSKYWEPFQWDANFDTQTDNDSYKLPSEVLSSAAYPQNGSSNFLNFYIQPTNISKQYFFYLHIAENLPIKEGQIWELNVDINGQYEDTITLQYLKPVTVFSPRPMSGTRIDFTITSTVESNYRPILNALEVFRLVEIDNTLTAPDDGMFSYLFPSKVTELQILDLIATKCSKLKD